MTLSLCASLWQACQYLQMKIAGSGRLEESPTAPQAVLPARHKKGNSRIRWSLSLWIAVALLPGTALAGSIEFPVNGTALEDLSFLRATVQSRDRGPGTFERTTNFADIKAQGIDCTATKTVTVNGTAVPGDPTTFKTNIEGLGVRFYASKGWQGGATLAPFTESLEPVSSLTGSFLLRAEEVVYGVLGSGVLTSLPSMNITFSGSCFPTVSRNQFIKPGTVVTLRSCSVTTPMVQVPMFPIRLSDLPVIGSTAGTTPFSLGLNCDRGIALYVTLTDASNLANRSTILSLATDSSASGVGLQILNGQTPVAYGPDSPLAGTPNQLAVGGYTAGGSMKVPLQVRYIRTGSNLGSGSVIGRATFTMSYQ
ncbi:fimbrial protein [Pararobbsia alpina]|uniref:Fimbrial-type adhesion domain-containing protein n=1 Tax=Pararobbsia alpina TaxID=621374 RepID=A0A6S7B2G2_9BURK|nr:fimbrial protein [Pararobbsia alpina]CAB3785663.1 hypothetical protein LMG28138_02033 [Pararobbsia alpina]